ncbi:uncharacterized protein [Hoplias malabaricus]|uniref:uncharacterized protein n=1 Tax=Hoplias malabaricus TaxID=27720 RepID=UPI00346376C4
MEKGWLLLSRREMLNIFNPFTLRGAVALATTGALIYGIRRGGFSWIWGRKSQNNQDASLNMGVDGYICVGLLDNEANQHSSDHTPLNTESASVAASTSGSNEVDDSNVSSEQPGTSLRPARRTSAWYDLSKRGCTTKPLTAYALATGVHKRQLEAQKYRPQVECRIVVIHDPEYEEMVRRFDETTFIGRTYRARGPKILEARTFIFLDEEPESSVKEEMPSTSQQQDVEGSVSGAEESGSSAGEVVQGNGHSESTSTEQCAPTPATQPGEEDIEGSVSGAEESVSSAGVVVAQVLDHPESTSTEQCAPTPATNSRRWKIGSRLRKALRAFSCCSASRDSNSEPEPAVQDEPNQNQGSRTPRRSGGFLRRLFHKRR